MEAGTSDGDFLLDDGEEDGMADKYLSFRLGEESYGIAIRFVTEIIELPAFSPVPDMPSFVRGVMNIRGSVILVMDLRLRLRMPERPYDDRSCVVVIKIPGGPAAGEGREGGAIELGLVVDTVEEVCEIPASDVESVPRLRASAGEASYIAGIGKAGDKVKILLDIEKITGEDIKESLEKSVGGANCVKE
jgi:purine-binding chemotaxis protein CheW